jgi:urea carboxylase-associated protein 2
VTLAIPEERRLFEELVPGGAMWSWMLRRHDVLRLIDVEGGANVSLLLYNRDQLLERYNMPDTLKAQHTAFLTKGRVLLSDMGRVLCSMIEDTSGWHDTVCGVSDAALVQTKWGERRYQEHRNECFRNGRDQLLVELGKWGMGMRDLVPNVNLFSKVVADAQGVLSFVPSHARAGAMVELRAELNVLAVMTTCQHPLDPSPTYAPKPVQVEVYRGDPPGPDDLCRRSRPEAARGLLNSALYFGAAS